MQAVDPNALMNKQKKAPAKLKGGEPFDAEPGASAPTEEWKDAQAALLRLTVKQDRSYGNMLPQLDGYTSQEYAAEYEWDEKAGRYYWRQYLTWKISYRYYRGQKKRSYLFWPKHCQPGWLAVKIVEQMGGKEVTTLKVNTESGTAEYAYLGKIDFSGGQKDPYGYYGAKSHVFALWRSTGTVKPRRTRKADNGTLGDQGA